MSMHEQIRPSFALSDALLQVEALRQALEHPRAGAFASFEGWVRNHNDGRSVAGLRYEAYAALAQAEGQRVLDEAMTRFSILQAQCVHRVGELGIGEMAVWVGVSAAHRGAAFEACRFIIDEVKARVPIWKHEHYLEGDAGWLHPESQ
ncbi:molybdenum cofactor biosynthesis protein MoaE [Xanthomonas campestris]|nr:molybdenum cofactor biosynthesis protein MoaE [Xanthomonas campestris]MEB1152180.1 molybdenum cofactor biosynthesis protein MoaE [Xanthomonas campestris pv. campestris]MCC5083590.1 molybdenum cofactor biosynthesis protein MoaE [Xanthomonas campestris]MCC5098169.1 molybdenum cofactor biosynthesis protein MoaE [Xanthomonas campestris]MEA9583737.1 molybdenum cofactor biosynthesis protein MoaE [Xanthomonas campestris]MEA9593179.1 molybdenum cofactor biosynthesis protein MoaE [Xanthomonas campes